MRGFHYFAKCSLQNEGIEGVKWGIREEKWGTG